MCNWAMDWTGQMYASAITSSIVRIAIRVTMASSLVVFNFWWGMLVRGERVNSVCKIGNVIGSGREKEREKRRRQRHNWVDWRRIEKKHDKLMMIEREKKFNEKRKREQDCKLFSLFLHLVSNIKWTKIIKVNERIDGRKEEGRYWRQTVPNIYKMQEKRTTIRRKRCVVLLCSTIVCRQL